jgi:hypothetical protein
MPVLGQAFSLLQYLRQLKLSKGNCLNDIGIGLALQGISALTNLTSLTLPEVRYAACMQSDVHLCCKKGACCSLLL